MNNNENQESKIAHLIFNTEPVEDFNDFMNQSLSDVGPFSLDLFKSKKENSDS